ncbi:MAG: hypothetical protein HYR70_05685 [Chloroflexi bacterium]|nr:hypothetical protein [Chloroflexota bacterium]MBI1854415.1 hypothetical protein [Chloroflexota bacterium]MBI3338725.1 hypothetical protein [Chloroflexota bacterium]
MAGTGKANPTAAILASAMLLDHLGEKGQAIRLRNAVESCIADGQATPDLGGVLTTSQMTQQVIQRLI